MDVKLHHCFLIVDDHDKALGFYRDTLGFEVRNDVSYAGMRWVTVGPRSQPDVNIVLEPPAADPGISPSDREVISDLLAKGLLRGLNFSTPDLDGTFDRVQATGADVVQEPMDMPYGTRECAFRDPAGNMIRFIQTSG
jgi:catechol 2,3-dioxygenase-like lactoylglutathione lyase family enzyme